ncbi:MAG: T9SS type A sorting domain-containing protein [Rhodothermia bacterium]
MIVPLRSNQRCNAGAGDGFDWIQGGTPCDIAQSATGSCSFNDPNLPVELTSFDAVSDGLDAVILRWETASETNNSGFDIEMEIGTGLFEALDFVPGYGTTTEPQTYSYMVSGLDPGVHVFRLKQIDFDGAFEYSALVEASTEIPNRFVLEDAYPNPFNPTTTIRFAVAAEQVVYVALYDATGREVRTLFNGTAPANSMQTISIDGTGLASGVYHVRLEGEGMVASRTVTLLK